MKTTKTTFAPQPSHAALAFVVMSFLLSLVPFQGKSLVVSKERAAAPTEVVVANKPNQRKLFSLSFFLVEEQAAKNTSFRLAPIHSQQVNITLKNLAGNSVPARRPLPVRTVFVSETEDHILA